MFEELERPSTPALSNKKMKKAKKKVKMEPTPEIKVPDLKSPNIKIC